MSLQIFLEGKLLGVDDCLLALASKDPDRVFTGRSHWISLLSEILPRALLAELGLAKILLGSSGGSQFLVVLPEESRLAAEAFLEAAAKDIAALSAGALKLIWSMTGRHCLPPRFPSPIPPSMNTSRRSWVFLCATPAPSIGRRNRPAASSPAAGSTPGR
jgi:hypothetical protein